MASGKRGGAQASPTAALDRVEAQDRQRLAAAAQRKLAAGEKPTARESAAYRAVVKEQTERHGAQYAHNCPKGHLSDKTGIQHKTLGEISRELGFSYHTSGKTVDLFRLLGEWYAFKARYKHQITRMLKFERLSEVLGDDESLEYWQTELVKERTLKEREARETRARELVPFDLVHAFCQEFIVDPMAGWLDQLGKTEQPLPPDQVADRIRRILRELESGAEELTAEPDDDDVP